MHTDRRVGVSLLSLVAATLVAASGCATTAAETARGQWFEVKSPRFQVWTDGDPEEARALVADLERFHQVTMTKTTAQENEAAPPLRIFLAKDGGSFRALTGKGGMVAGLFRPTYRGNYAITESQQGAQASAAQLSDRHVLFHEYTHYILALGGARIPSWYNEGFAEYMATTEFVEGGTYTIGCPPLYRTAWVSRMEWLPLSKVLDAEDVATLVKGGSGYVRTRRDPTDSYLQSWYMFHYFASDGERQKKLREYLRLWAGGVPSQEAVQSAMGFNVAQLDATMREYAQSRTFECASIKPAVPLKEPLITVLPLSKADAHYHVGDVALASFGATDAVFELLRTANAEGNDPRVLRALARAHWHKAMATEGDVSGELKKARTYLEQAQRIAPDDAEGMALDGHILELEAERMPGEDGEARKAKVAAARKAYRKAIKADEALAEAYVGLGYTYLVDDNGSQEARVSLEVAAYLLPLETDIALTLGKILVARRSLLEAIPALEYVLRWSSNPKQRDKARQMLADIRELAKPPAPGDGKEPAPAAESSTTP